MCSCSSSVAASVQSPIASSTSIFCSFVLMCCCIDHLFTSNQLSGTGIVSACLASYLVLSTGCLTPSTLCRLSTVEQDDKVVVLRHFVTTKEAPSSLPEVMHHRFILQVRWCALTDKHTFETCWNVCTVVSAIICWCKGGRGLVTPVSWSLWYVPQR